MTQAQQPVTLEDWKRRVNTIAACSRKDDRYRVGAELKQDIAGAIEALKAAPAAQAVEPAVVVPGQHVTVNAGALQMVINALRRDAAEGKIARGEMADELLATVTPAPAAVAVPDEDLQDLVSKALLRAWQLGQTYWQQADSEYTSHHKKADETQAKFSALIEETRATLASTPAAQAQPVPDEFGTAEHWKEKAQYWAGVAHKLRGQALRGEPVDGIVHPEPQAQDVQRDAARVSLPIHWMKELVALCGPEDHELRDRVLKYLERLPLAHAGQLDELNKGEVLVVVTGYTGTGKIAVAGEIEIMCRALGLEVEWPGGDSEKNMTHADWTAALEQYRPRVRIVERNVPDPIAASAAKGG